MTEEPVYVRYVYLTPKGKELLESIEKALERDVALRKIPKYKMPSRIPKEFQRSEEKEVQS